MQYTMPTNSLTSADVLIAGGKAVRLAVMAAAGVRVPNGICITTNAYESFMASSGLQERILLELSRKAFDQMRWEEIWDAALRIRHMFLNATLPVDIRNSIQSAINQHFRGQAVVVRSTSPAEDTEEVSFAGLHESFVNVRGTDKILEHIRLVWASLWSDRAMLYRKELGLDLKSSAMAVIIQPLLTGEVSGIVFGKHPLEPEQMVVEAVYGLNQGLVEGDVEPDRWILDRHNGYVINHQSSPVRSQTIADDEGTKVVSRVQSDSNDPPLSDSQLHGVVALSQQLEELFGEPQDVEWTYADSVLWALQSRPITHERGTEEQDKRPWYLTLHRSFENLKQLREKIENEILPGMAQEAANLDQVQWNRLTDHNLADEIERREEVLRRWTDVYWEYCIPFAHGVRLFGQVYNDTLHPDDPFEFVELLTGAEFVTLKRNEKLARLAEATQQKPQLLVLLETGQWDALEPSFRECLEAFLADFGTTSSFAVIDKQECSQLAVLLRTLASQLDRKILPDKQNKEQMVERFINAFGPQRRDWAYELLDLAQASYRLRDDDNFYLSRLEGLLILSQNEALVRLRKRGLVELKETEAKELIKALRDESYVPRQQKKEDVSIVPKRVYARQLVGQPASRGLASASARVIHKRHDLFSVQVGEILVCDAVSPDMTFAIPLTTGIVERRGGMLIHGAIIAREYGIPCVTGISDATELIHTGDWITVDGYFGVVTVKSAKSEANTP
ncbi:MAG: PEP/pyruvate-binding domain-containing protein [Planctomycetota bacterium]|jgi:pyruvate,water dikinase